jgi:hypothetical protein
MPHLNNVTGFQLYFQPRWHTAHFFLGNTQTPVSNFISRIQLLSLPNQVTNRAEKSPTAVIGPLGNIGRVGGTA